MDDSLGLDTCQVSHSIGSFKCAGKKKKKKLGFELTHDVCYASENGAAVSEVKKKKCRK